MNSEPLTFNPMSPQTLMLNGEADSLSPSSKPHICEHCNAAFRSSYHLRRHVLIHTGMGGAWRGGQWASVSSSLAQGPVK